MEKQKKKRSPVWIVLLVILLVLAGGAGYVYYSACKAPLELEDPAVLAAAKPMEAQERIVVSADGTARVRIDATDFWSLVLEHTGADFLDLINQEVASYGLTVAGCGIGMDEDGLWLDLELLYKENRLLTKVPVAVEFQGTHLSLTPAGVKVGVIPLPVEGLLSDLKLEFDLTLPVISQVTGLEYSRDGLVLTGPVEDATGLMDRDEILYQAAIFSRELQAVAEPLMAGESLASLLARESAATEDVYRALFTMAGPEAVQEYLDARLGLTERFFPGIDFEALTAEQAALEEQLTAQSIALEQLFTEVVNLYNEKRFQLSGGEFLFAENSWQKKEPFQVAQYGAERYAELFSQLDPEDFFLILVDAQDGFLRKTSSFYRMCDEDQQFTQEMDFNKTYILGFVFRSVDGDPYLLYETQIETGNTYSRGFRYIPLTEETVAQLRQEGKFGVWTD